LNGYNVGRKGNCRADYRQVVGQNGVRDKSRDGEADGLREDAVQLEEGESHLRRLVVGNSIKTTSNKLAYFIAIKPTILTG